MLSQSQSDALVALRQELHAHPEVSGDETLTRDRVADYLKNITPNAKIIKAGKGLLAIFQGFEEGPTTMIRAELDALPIQEVNDMSYKSLKPGVSHKCGHDGHMCMVIGLAYLLQEQTLKKGKVVLLFQSAEETGQGAQWMLEEAIFQSLKPDYAFALHNLPGLPMHEITCKSGTFCAASTGIKIDLFGKTAHASSPETGVSPVVAVSRLTAILNRIVSANDFTDFTLLTITHLQVGEPTFGVSPGNAELRLTIRAYQDHDLEKLKNLIQTQVEEISRAEGLAFAISYHEPFAATVNNTEGVSMVEEVANHSGLDFKPMPKPNPWSEDFGLFLQKSKSAMFGLGSGTDQPALHNPDYDFPDELIETGIKMFWGLIQRLNY